METPLIRPYASSDREACLGIFRSNIPKYFTVEEESWYRRWLDGLDGVLPPEDPGGEARYFVVECKGIACACGGWGIRATDDHATLIWGTVHNDRHREGIGTMLTQFRIEDFRKAHPSLPMTIDTSHYTAPFYERFGFRTERFTENGYTEGLHRHDMRLS